MLERDNGPVVIEDFPDDDPRAQPDAAWQPPRVPKPSAGATGDALASMLEAEIVLLQGARQRWITGHGRSTVGLTGLPISDTGQYIGEWLRGKSPPSPRDGFSAPLILRFAVDDLKAHHLEAATAGTASSRQLGDWLWNDTAAGAAIHAVREMCLVSEDERLKLIGGNFLVPAARVRSSG
jgi:hypothetical protein